MSTPVCELLGIEQPIVLAPMVAVPRLAAAVSNAGALGMLTLTWSDDIGALVHETAKLTERPFGGNLVLTEDRHRRLDQALEAGLRIVSFMWGDPSGYVKQVHDAGGIAMLTVGTALTPCPARRTSSASTWGTAGPIRETSNSLPHPRPRAAPGC